jgi:hypothetical protein
MTDTRAWSLPASFLIDWHSQRTLNDRLAHQDSSHGDSGDRSCIRPLIMARSSANARSPTNLRMSQIW